MNLQPCNPAGVPGTVLCGKLQVLENRGQKDGRLIPLNIMILQAQSEPKRPDSLFALQGGPGQAVTRLASFYAQVFASIRKSRDIVLVDVRGTGDSNGLYCDIHADSGNRLDELFPLKAVKACREKLASQADLTQYNTRVLVRDLVDVLDALRIEKINIYGTSYGTRLALELARLHPDRVRTMTLKGVAPVGFTITEHYSRDAYAALLKVTNEEDRRGLDELLKRDAIRAGDLEVSSGVLSETTRMLLYAPQSARRLPGIVKSALAGDASGFRQMASMLPRQYAQDVAIGMFLSVTCSEDIPFVKGRANPGITSRTLGEFRRQQQKNACAEWPRAKIDKDFRKPFRTSVPALLFSGMLDPVTPPVWGDEALKLLSNGRHFILEENGHPMGERAPCIAETMAPLLDNGSLAHVFNLCSPGPPQAVLQPNP